MGSDERNETRDHEGQTKDRKFFANIQKRLALLCSSEVATIAYSANDQSHKQSVQAGIKDDVANNGAQRLHNSVDGLRKTESCACFHYKISSKHA